MTVYPLLTDFVRLYSKGIEIKYNGTNIEYNDSTNTFLFFYYSSYTVVYVINGIKKDFTLVQVKQKINRIAVYSSKEARRFIRFFNYILNKDDNTIFYLPPLFFRECWTILFRKNYMKIMLDLYDKYKTEISEGKYYPKI